MRLMKLLVNIIRMFNQLALFTEYHRLYITVSMFSEVFVSSIRCYLLLMHLFR